MIEHSTHHCTIVLERTYDAPIVRVFAAFSDPVARERWSAPSGTTVLIYDEAEFRVEGRDVFRCSAKSDPRYRGETRYHNIVPNCRIVSTEVIDDLDKRLSVSVATLELKPERGRSRRCPCNPGQFCIKEKPNDRHVGATGGGRRSWPADSWLRSGLTQLIPVK
jgi:uncharacterized protein YndB with AHSA1/START domain